MKSITVQITDPIKISEYWGFSHAIDFCRTFLRDPEQNGFSDLYKSQGLGRVKEVASHVEMDRMKIVEEFKLWLREQGVPEEFMAYGLNWTQTPEMDIRQPSLRVLIKVEEEGDREQAEAEAAAAAMEKV